MNVKGRLMDFVGQLMNIACRLDDFVIGQVGMMNPEYLLATWKALLFHFPNFSFLIFSSGLVFASGIVIFDTPQLILYVF
jgi:hypothetical protein